MTHRASLGAALLAAATLAGCVNNAPAPTDQYYRLRAETPQAPGAAATRTLGVGEFRADGLLRERAMVFSDDVSQRVLKQHTYHHWADSPPRMVRDYWTQRLRPADSDAAADLTVHGRILRMERLLDSGHDAVALSLQLRLRARGHVGDVLRRDYTVIRPTDSGRVVDSVKAYEAAMDEIIGRFLADVSAATPLAQGPD